MMNADRSKADRLRRDLASLRNQPAKEGKKEAEASAKAARARAGTAQARSETTARSKTREADREERKVLQALKKRASLDAKAAQKAAELAKLESKLADREAKALRELEAETQRRDQASRAGLLRDLGVVASAGEIAGPARSYDFFISHPTPDKESVARPLAVLLRERSRAVWLDEQEDTDLADLARGLQAGGCRVQPYLGRQACPKDCRLHA